MGSSKNRRARQLRKRRREARRELRRRVTSLNLTFLRPGDRVQEGPVEGLPKMSETLLEFAEPVFDALPDDGSLERIKFALVAAQIAWNAFVFGTEPDDSARRTSDDLREEFIRVMGEALGDAGAAAEVLDELADLRDEYAYDRRTIARVHAERRGNRVHVTAAAALFARQD